MMDLGERPASRLNYLPYVRQTEYQKIVVNLAIEGLPAEEIAENLERTKASVKTCIKTVLSKLDWARMRDVRERRQAIEKAAFNRTMRNWCAQRPDGGLSLLMGGCIYPEAYVHGLGIIGKREAEFIASENNMEKHFDFSVMTRYGAEFSAKFRCYSKPDLKRLVKSGTNFVGYQAGWREVERVYRG